MYQMCVKSDLDFFLPIEMYQMCVKSDLDFFYQVKCIKCVSNLT